MTAVDSAMDVGPGSGTERTATAHGFRRTLALGAVAAIGLPLALCVSETLFGDGFGRSGAWRASEIGLGLYWVLAAACTLAVALSGRRARTLALCGASLGGVAVVLLGPSLMQLAVGLTILVALVRSGLLHGRWHGLRGSGRAVAIEAVCGVASLGLAYVLYSPTLLGAALSLWGWFLVQSCFYLLVGVTPRRRPGDSDPFDLARARLLELLRS